MKRRIERPLLHLQDRARDLLDAVRDSVPVGRFERHDSQNQHVERALQDVGFVGSHDILHIRRHM
jgi:hypothetical protein